MSFTSSSTTQHSLLRPLADDQKFQSRSNLRTMPNPRSHRKGKLTEKSSSFHGESPTKTATTLRRPKTDPELLSFKNLGLSAPSLDGRPKMTKLLLNVTIQGSIGPVHVLMSPEMTVADLVAATVRQYSKEARRPILPTADPSVFDLHYSQFSLESLDKEEKLIALGSRNFFLCPRKSDDINDDLVASSSSSSSLSSSCSKQAKESAKSSSVEVKAGELLFVKPEDQKYLHLSQAALGESKKGKTNEPVTVFLKIDDQKLVLGTLSAENFPQLSFDLVFEKEFELSHNGKGVSICCLGYHAAMDDREHEEYSDSDFGSEDEELALQQAPNGKPLQKEEKSIVGKMHSLKPEATEKSDVKSLEPSKEEEEDSDSEDDESDEDEDSDDESDEDLLDGKISQISLFEEMIEADSDSDDEEIPKVQSNKKRPNEPASKTPVSKKSKLGSDEKSDAKKGGHTATPHPAKKPVKTPVKIETPKSGGKFSCKSCDKSFGSDGGLQSHTKAKHGGK